MYCLIKSSLIYNSLQTWIRYNSLISWINLSRIGFIVHSVFKNCFLVSVYCIWLTDIILELLLNLCYLLCISSWIVFYKNYSFSILNRIICGNFQVFNSLLLLNLAKTYFTIGIRARTWILDKFFDPWLRTSCLLPREPLYIGHPRFLGLITNFRKWEWRFLLNLLTEVYGMQ